jgi:hypothetical protein
MPAREYRWRHLAVLISILLLHVVALSASAVVEKAGL